MQQGIIRTYLGFLWAIFHELIMLSQEILDIYCYVPCAKGHVYSNLWSQATLTN